MLVERHATETFRLAAAIVGVADAADVTQETFVAAWQQLPKLRDAGAFTGSDGDPAIDAAVEWLESQPGCS